MFRPCIDLHEGKVKQIVGGTLTDHGAGPRTNFVSEKPADWYAALYREDQLRGGHVIMLGAGNESAAEAALAAYPGGMHVGGGIHDQNALRWLQAGASHVIVTSHVFKDGRIHWERLENLASLVTPQRLVLDLSCRVREDRYLVVTDRWQIFTQEELNASFLQKVSAYCSEFLIHAADVEGLCRGIDLRLVEKLADWAPIPTVYAGGAQSLHDLETVTRVSGGRIDLTIGSALDIFGGHGVRYQDAVNFNRQQPRPTP